MRQRRSTVARRLEATGAVGDATSDACLTPGANPERAARGRALLPDAHAQVAIAETFRALADPTRVSIVLSLLRQELCTCDLAEITGVSESAVSQHLRVLRQLRLVKSRRVGRMVFHSLDDLHIRILLTVCLHHTHDAGQEHADQDGQDGQNGHDGLERVLDFFPALLEDPAGEGESTKGKAR